MCATQSGAARNGLCDARGGRGQGFLPSHKLCTIRQLLVYGRQNRLFLQTVPAAHWAFQGHDHMPPPSCSLPFTDELGAHHFAFLVALLRRLLPLNFNNRSDVNSSLDIKIAGTCFSQGGRGELGPCCPRASSGAGVSEIGRVRFSPPVTGGAAPAMGRSVDNPLARSLAGLLQD